MDAMAWGGRGARERTQGIAVAGTTLVVLALALLQPARVVEMTDIAGAPAAEATPTWLEVGRGPPPRMSPSLTYDEAHALSILFGGDPRRGDTWTWDGTAWAHPSDIGPSSRAAAAFVYDTARGKALLFGGRASGNPLGDTWEWSGSAWTRVSSVGPAPRWSAAMAFDGVRQRAVLFGGTSGAAPLDDTWEWDGTTWQRVCVACGGPPARTSGAATFDRARGRVVMYGGADASGAELADTWEWDGAHWTAPCGDGCASPGPRSLHAMTYDAKAGVSVLFGGYAAENGRSEGTWTWDGLRWKDACPPPCAYSAPASDPGVALTYDLKRARAVLFAPGDTSGLYEWDGTSWAQRTIATPGPLDGHAMAYDAKRARVVLFGGQNLESTVNATWEWNGASWAAACPNCTDVPTPRFGHAMVYDAARAVTLLFGGTRPLQGAAANTSGETWKWDGTVWTQLCSGCMNLPGARFGHAMAYDPLREVTVLFGGQRDTSLYRDTWEWDGLAWQKRSDGGPSARSRHAMAYDPVHHVTVLFGGADDRANNETWTWDGTAWALQNPVTRPAPRTYGLMAYDAHRQVIVLFGGSDAATFDDTWDWDGSEWSQESPSQHPPARTGHAMVYDDGARRIVVNGGFGDHARLGDTWAHFGVGDACSAGATCDTGQCVDGVCCTAACGACEDCAGSVQGTCIPVTGRPDPGSCDGDRSCDPTGRCRKNSGVACAAGGDCISGFCVDGVCCSSACNGTCQACRASKKSSGPDGECGNAVDGTDPHDECSVSDVCTCGLDGTCDGAGHCRSYVHGTSCAGCAGGEAAGLYRNVCNGFGKCEAVSDVRCDGDRLVGLDGGIQSCAPYRCSAEGTCFETCTSSDKCAPPYICSATNECVAPPMSGDAPDAPSCGVARGKREGKIYAAVALFAFCILRKRRRA